MKLIVRLRNPYFWVWIAGVVLSATGVSANDLTSWAAVRDCMLAFVGNPVAVGGTLLAVLGILCDPTTKGLSDSLLAKTYEKPYDVMTELEHVYQDDRRDGDEK